MVTSLIDVDGSVRSSETKSSTLEDPEVEACVHRVFEGLRFPARWCGGIVVVRYPFMFSPDWYQPMRAVLPLVLLPLGCAARTAAPPEPLPGAQAPQEAAPPEIIDLTSLDPEATAALAGLVGAKGVQLSDEEIAARGLAPPAPRPAPDLSPVELLEPPTVMAIIGTHSIAFGRCFGQARAEDRSLAGEVVVELAVAPSGAPAAARVVESSLGSPSCEACLVRVFMEMAFPPSQAEDDVIVRYPLGFYPGGG